MKKLVLLTGLFASMAVSAGELKVMELPSSDVSHGHLHTRFEVNLNSGTAGVSATITRRRPGRGGGTTYTHTFKEMVPELSMVGGDLVLNVDGAAVVCGTMGETRIFRRAVLNVNGNCDLVRKFVKTSSGRKFQLFIKY